MDSKPYNLTPEEERQLIDSEFDDLLQGYVSSNHRKKVDIIKRAFKFARQAHEGVRRRSGEPYILHPIAVAKIASREIGLGSTSICAALLHDVVEDTEYRVEDIEQQFGKKIAELVAGLTKISGGIFGDRASAQAENFRKLLLTMSQDIRVVLIKMADRLHNMRTLGSMAPNKQYKIAGETLYIYAPLAHRLGLFGIKTELEDLSFKFEHPAEYDRIASLLKGSEEKREMVYNNFAAPIHQQLARMGLTYEAKARVKSVYSIWRKMETKHIPFDEVYDLYAMRIIFDAPEGVGEKEMCYRIYAALTDLYRPHPDRIRDWITVPKANGYQALHVTLMGPDGNWVEVQIRSRKMDEIAEKGFAAHWKYKIGGESEEESELTVWLRTIKDILDDPNPNAIDFLDTLKLNLFSSEIVVFTPKGELLTLPAGATVLDVAYTLHSEIGNHCIAGKVNHKLVPLSQKLNSGDQVEVLTSQSQTPKPEWMSFLSTAKGKTRLRKELRRVQQPFVEEGRKIFEKFLDDNNIILNNDVITKILGRYQVQTREELFLKLGSGEASIDDYLNVNTSSGAKSLVSRLFRLGFGGKTNRKRGNHKSESEGHDRADRPKINPKETYILHDDGSERNFSLADCCRPIPGDDVMGFLTYEGGVEIHALTCPHAQKLKAGHGDRILAVKWDSVSREFIANILIEGIDRHGILQELTGMISSTLDIDIRRLNIEAKGEVFTCYLDVKVTDTAQVDGLCSKVLKINGVKRADRMK
ncbi:bifunctional (p)ppGpp synthetase/guanosine-3',5'-bis(diphosphate) 3'-pyrophosphohydrolase [uncultured Duncaniella sp.]|uniref:RelA/SpoT family protein n=1 Tax=uncultured Duncaniella sp. TaxID=2768039 RepID=UPI0026753690|nr:RelA/SpoT family protein [uncultured Duncaniella sp.]MCI9172078.1 bifunctional (p)ppGpp synthetase/guanosine-3',5'-bis(diphosphate) 3'-pyrophosphohydrolase [Muribaculaceae bacterium]